MDIRREIVFVYDREASRKKKQFTVRLSLRRFCADNRWVQDGPMRVYSVSDLESVKKMASDVSLLEKLSYSEMLFRKREGRFLSPSDDFTLLRVQPDLLCHFLKTAEKRSSVCWPDGQIFSFPKNISSLVLKVEISEKGFIPRFFLEQIPLSGMEYVVDSVPLLAFHEKKLFALHEKLNAAFLESLPDGKMLGTDEWEKLLSRFQNMKEGISLDLPEGTKAKKVFSKSDVYPVLDIHPHFQYATLYFDYPEKIRIKSSDERLTIQFYQKGIELQRNREEELSYLKKLKDLGITACPSPLGEWYLPTCDAEKILDSLEKEGWQLQVEGSPLYAQKYLTWSVEVRENKIHVKGETTCRGKKITLGEMVSAARNNQKYLSVYGVGSLYLSKAVMDDLLSISEKGLLTGDSLVFKDSEISRVSRFVQKQVRVETDSHFQALAEFERNFDKLKPIPVPSSLKEVLRPYQKQGFYWLSFMKSKNFCGILADDMGLGKTVQVLTLLLSLREAKDPRTHLLIVPPTLVYNWQAEIKKFTPLLRCLVHSGKERSRDPQLFKQTDLVITTYPLVRRDSELMRSFEWDYLILDESQIIKNPDAQVTSEIKTIPSRWRLCLSGTPLENSPVDLWSQFDFLMPGFLGTLRDFQERYPRTDPASMEDLKTLIKPFFLRRLKSQVCTELPSKTEVIQYCEFTDEQKLSYSEVLKKGKKELLEIKDGPEEKKKNRVFHILELLLRLRQISCHPELVFEQKDPPWQSGKLDALLEMTKEVLEEGHKILIFSQFVQHLKIVRRAFNERSISWNYLDGDTKDRERVIRDFCGKDGPCVFLISLKTGGLGLNLTAADYVFLLDPWWNPSVENQAIDRCHRIGQENSVMVYRFITKDSIEEKVSALQKEKQQLSNALITAAPDGDVPLSEAMLEKLLMEEPIVFPEED
ncbi:MAG: DEAD/DEAH box helicase [Candidatus Aureabacteria bacterium]|nr:DEAD/DEAH box helicase [Candidatus Auribacterota bacterium]